MGPHLHTYTSTRNAVKVKMRIWSQLVNLATLKMCKSSTVIFSVACGNTVQSSYLNSAPTEVEYLVNSVTSSLCTTLHTLALLKKEGNKSEIPENAAVRELTVRPHFSHIGFYSLAHY